MNTKERDAPVEIEALEPDAKHARESQVTPSQIDDSLAMQLISIRLPKALLDDLKFVADMNGLGYQPLIRRVLVRFVEAEFKIIARQLKDEADKDQCDPPPLKRKTA